MGVPPNHPVMDDHFIIEPHGFLGISILASPSCEVFAGAG